MDFPIEGKVNNNRAEDSRYRINPAEVNDDSAKMSSHFLTEDMNIFKNIPDCIFYFTLIIAIPIAQCLMAIRDMNCLFFVTAIIMVLGIAYDGFGRYDKKASKGFRRIISWGIYGVSAYLLLVLICLWILFGIGIPIPNQCILLYIPIVVPIIIVSACFVGHIKRHKDRKSCTK